MTSTDKRLEHLAVLDQVRAAASAAVACGSTWPDVLADFHDTRDLESFAAALADELPGNWRSAYHRHEQYPGQFPIAEDVWDMNLVSAAIAECALEHAAVLTRDDGTRLYLIARPRHHDEFLVGAMAPPGLDPEAFRGVREPDGIAVPDDPFRAAEDIAADLLPRYTKAVAQVHHNATQHVIRCASNIGQQ